MFSAQLNVIKRLLCVEAINSGKIYQSSKDKNTQNLRGSAICLRPREIAIIY